MVEAAMDMMYTLHSHHASVEQLHRMWLHCDDRGAVGRGLFRGQNACIFLDQHDTTRVRK